MGKREVSGGAVNVHKTVTQEQVNMPVELHREEAHIEKVDTPDRPLRAGEDAFKEESFQIPLRAEEAVVNKEAIVTGEVVVNKTQETERRNVGDTVRRERVEVDQGATSGYAAQQNTNYNSTPTTSGTSGLTKVTLVTPLLTSPPVRLGQWDVGRYAKDWQFLAQTMKILVG